jgi:putative SOS response-associated peptidase YedK
MCGRYVFVPDNNLKDRFSLKNNIDSLVPNYNVSPGEFLPVIINDNGNMITLMRWGLIPSWAKDPNIAYRLINARADSVSFKPSFRTAFKHRRCLIPASGFYEWKKEGKHKQPYYFVLKDKSTFAFAGLWDQWLSPDGSEIQTYTIITTDPNSLVNSVHNRMPVILQKEDESIWLENNFENEDKYLSLLQPLPESLMKFYPVSPEVNQPVKNSADLIKPIS